MVFLVIYTAKKKVKIFETFIKSVKEFMLIFTCSGTPDNTVTSYFDQK